MLLGNKMSSLQTWPAFSQENDFQISGTKRFAGKGEAIGRGKKKEIAQIVRDDAAVVSLPRLSLCLSTD